MDSIINHSGRKLAIQASKEAAIAFAAHHFLEIAKESIDDHGAFFVALSGGSTPKALYEMLFKEYSKALDWSLVHLFFSDERSVPEDSDKSNYKMAMDTGLKDLVPSHQVHRMVAEEDIEANAKRYENLIHSILKDRPFDLVILGMGEDGHTASLFPKTPALNIKDHLIASNFVESQKTFRMTMTYSCINRARHIAIYVLGRSKAEVLKKVFLEKEGSFPIQGISEKALWITDREAASKL
ncbi:MAG: 6-phosphogluconolactonase [Simkaniaceae bacterium]